MQRIVKRAVWISVPGIAYALLVTSFGCSQLGKRYVSIDVESDPAGASVSALVSSKLSGTFTPDFLGKAPTGIRTIHFAFGAPGRGRRQNRGSSWEARF